MLVLDETRRAGSDPESLGQLERMIRRDRNRACVFAWSLANEEWSIQGTSDGAAVMTAMQNLAHSLDSTRKCTAALNGAYGPDGFISVLDVAGINYNQWVLSNSFPHLVSLRHRHRARLDDRHARHVFRRHQQRLAGGL